MEARASRLRNVGGRVGLAVVVAAAGAGLSKGFREADVLGWAAEECRKSGRDMQLLKMGEVEVRCWTYGSLGVGSELKVGEAEVVQTRFTHSAGGGWMYDEEAPGKRIWMGPVYGLVSLNFFKLSIGDFEFLHDRWGQVSLGSRSQSGLLRVRWDGETIVDEGWVK